MEQKMRRIESYADAVAAGNALLYLPLELRQEIFAFAALDYMKQHGFIEATGILQGRKCTWLPPMCHVNDVFFIESMPMFLRHTDVVIRESYTAYNLRFFLEATRTFAHVYGLRFTKPETLSPLSAGAALLSDCINLRHVWLSFHHDEVSRLKDFKVTDGHKINMKVFLEKYSFRQLLSLKHVEEITLFLIRDNESVPVPGGLNHFWGVAPWLEKKFQRRGRKVKVVSSIGRSAQLG